MNHRVTQIKSNCIRNLFSQNKDHRVHTQLMQHTKYLIAMHFLTSQIKMHLQISRMHNNEWQLDDNNVGKVSRDEPESSRVLSLEERICIVNHVQHQETLGKRRSLNQGSL